MVSNVVIFFLHTLVLSDVYAFTKPTNFFVTSRIDFEPSYATQAASAESETSKSTLVFRGELMKKSKSFPIEDKEELMECVRIPKYRNKLCATDSPITEIPVTPELLQEWKTATADLGGVEPTSSDTILSFESGSVNFPGLKLISVCYSGCKLLKGDGDSPVYEFTLIKDERTVSGLKPVVWIYNQLTGANKEKDNSNISSLTRVSIDKAEDGDGVAVQYDSLLEVRVSFPSLLLRILPVSKEKAEKQGSAAILKTVEKSVNEALEKFYDAFTNRPRNLKDLKVDWDKKK